MNRIKQLCDLLQTLTYDEMMEVAAALRDRLDGAPQDKRDEPQLYAAALSDFALYHFDGDAEE